MDWRSGRVVRTELLDSASAEQAKENLLDLVRINRWLGGHAIARRLMREIARPGESVSVLDVGAASGDMGEAIRAVQPRATVVSLDRRQLHLANAADPRVVADAFHLPFAARSFDIVFCSLFLHHFSDRQVVELLRELHGLARRALVVIDLERNRLAWWFLPLTRRLFGWTSMTVHDGCVSVEASFRKTELERLADAAGLPAPTVRRHLPWFRLSMVALR